MTDTAQTTPEASPEDRLTAYFGGEPAQKAEPEPETPAPVEASEETTEDSPLEVQDDEPPVEDEPLSDADGLELTYNGETERVDRERGTKLAQLGLHYERAQEKVVSELNQTLTRAREIASAAEELQKTPGEVINLRAKLQALEFMSMNDPLGALTPQNILAVAQQDPARAAEMQAKFQYLAAQYNATQAELNGAELRAKEQKKAVDSKAIDAERVNLHKIYPQVKDPAKFDTIKQGILKMNLRSHSLDAIDGNSELFMLAAKAYDYDRIQASKKEKLATANKAPQVVKPGAARPANAGNMERMQKARASLKKTGSVEDAARLLLSRMR